MTKELSPLEAFNKITSGGCKGKYHKYCEIVEAALKRLKALEIIIEGCPYISLGKKRYIDDDKPYELVIGAGYDTAYIELTQEEYELLKEVLL